MPAVLLHGPPAAGKDTTTDALAELDGRYRRYLRLKVGAGRTSDYRMTTLSHVNALRESGDIIWENRRYDALYVIDRTSLADMLAVSIPVLHVGQTEAVRAVTASVPATQWVVVSLWCPRDVAAERIAERGTGDMAARLCAWDETEPLPDADLSINTAHVHPAEVAEAIHCRVQKCGRPQSRHRHG